MSTTGRSSASAPAPSPVSSEMELAALVTTLAPAAALARPLVVHPSASPSFLGVAMAAGSAGLGAEPLPPLSMGPAASPSPSPSAAHAAQRARAPSLFARSVVVAPKDSGGDGGCGDRLFCCCRDLQSLCRSSWASPRLQMSLALQTLLTILAPLAAALVLLGLALTDSLRQAQEADAAHSNLVLAGAIQQYMRDSANEMTWASLYALQLTAAAAAAAADSAVSFNATSLDAWIPFSHASLSSDSSLSNLRALVSQWEGDVGRRWDPLSDGPLDAPEDAQTRSTRDAYVHSAGLGRAIQWAQWQAHRRVRLLNASSPDDTWHQNDDDWPEGLETLLVAPATYPAWDDPVAALLTASPASIGFAASFGQSSASSLLHAISFPGEGDDGSDGSSSGSSSSAVRLSVPLRAFLRSYLAIGSTLLGTLRAVLLDAQTLSLQAGSDNAAASAASVAAYLAALEATQRGFVTNVANIAVMHALNSSASAAHDAPAAAVLVPLARTSHSNAQRASELLHRFLLGLTTAQGAEFLDAREELRARGLYDPMQRAAVLQAHVHSVAGAVVTGSGEPGAGLNATALAALSSAWLAPSSFLTDASVAPNMLSEFAGGPLWSRMASRAQTERDGLVRTATALLLGIVLTSALVASTAAVMLRNVWIMEKRDAERKGAIAQGGSGPDRETDLHRSGTLASGAEEKPMWLGRGPSLNLARQASLTVTRGSGAFGPSSGGGGGGGALVPPPSPGLGPSSGSFTRPRADSTGLLPATILARMSGGGLGGGAGTVAGAAGGSATSTPLGQTRRRTADSFSMVGLNGTGGAIGGPGSGPDFILPASAVAAPDSAAEGSGLGWGTSVNGTNGSPSARHERHILQQSSPGRIPRDRDRDRRPGAPLFGMAGSSGGGGGGGNRGSGGGASFMFDPQTPSSLARHRSSLHNGVGGDAAFPAAEGTVEAANTAVVGIPRRDSLPFSGSTVRFAPMHDDSSTSPTDGGGSGGGGGGDATPSLHSAWGGGSHSRAVSESVSFLHSAGEGTGNDAHVHAHAHTREMSTLAEENAADLQAASTFVSACPTPLSPGSRTPATASQRSRMGSPTQRSIRRSTVPSSILGAIPAAVASAAAAAASHTSSVRCRAATTGKTFGSPSGGDLIGGSADLAPSPSGPSICGGERITADGDGDEEEDGDEEDGHASHGEDGPLVGAGVLIVSPSRARKRGSSGAASAGSPESPLSPRVVASRSPPPVHSSPSPMGHPATQAGLQQEQQQQQQQQQQVQEALPQTTPLSVSEPLQLPLLLQAASPPPPSSSPPPQLGPQQSQTQPRRSITVRLPHAHVSQVAAAVASLPDPALAGGSTLVRTGLGSPLVGAAPAPTAAPAHGSLLSDSTATADDAAALTLPSPTRTSASGSARASGHSSSHGSGSGMSAGSSAGSMAGMRYPSGAGATSGPGTNAPSPVPSSSPSSTHIRFVIRPSAG